MANYDKYKSAGDLDNQKEIKEFDEMISCENCGIEYFKSSMEKINNSNISYIEDYIYVCDDTCKTEFLK